MKVITKKEAEQKVAELIAWLAYADEVDKERQLKLSQRNYWIGKLAYMDENNLKQIKLKTTYE